MVGLSVVLEGQKGVNGLNNKTPPQVINKTNMNMNMMRTINKPHPLPPSPSSYSQSLFLDQCFLCRKRLLPGKDIYMYKGERAFCSVDCRCKHIFMDQEEAAQNQTLPSTSSSSTPPPPGPAAFAF